MNQRALDRGGKRRVACDARVNQRQDAGERRIGARREHLATPFPGTRLIRKVYEADPLMCPKCQGLMRVIALIEDPALVRAILARLPRSARRPRTRAGWMISPSVSIGYSTDTISHQCPDSSRRARHT